MTDTKHAQPPRQEHERRFLVIVPKLPAAMPPSMGIRQGYTRLDPYQERFRFIDECSAFLQFKGKGNFESAELAIPMPEAQYMLDQYRVAGSIDISKRRHVFPPRPDGFVWEVDVFHDENVGLFIAEIETPTAEAGLALDRATFPEFIGTEITHDVRFKNKNLTMRPFLSWPEEDRLLILRYEGRLP